MSASPLFMPFLPSINRRRKAIFVAPSSAHSRRRTSVHFLQSASFNPQAQPYRSAQSSPMFTKLPPCRTISIRRSPRHVVCVPLPRSFSSLASSILPINPGDPSNHHQPNNAVSLSHAPPSIKARKPPILSLAGSL
ncbi:hypothetical protein M0R45_035603 [Rubus argutus]|uniref:Uncharacterized protein n=1 Tax=Rubus argutus TaxID=59490 RepID=A0AAW1VXV4_RUBAR